MVVGAAEAECDAVHPGYGFLAEHADFAAAVATPQALTWIGPSADVIAMMGDKLAARQVAPDAGVPPVPGRWSPSTTPGRCASSATTLGWPLAVKAVHGGGGRGMRVIHGRRRRRGHARCRPTESQSSFGRPEVYVERFLARPRHVEVQIVADHHGGLVVVGDRDCSIQRRYQKLIEEARHRTCPTRCGRLADAASRLPARSTTPTPAPSSSSSTATSCSSSR